MKEVDTKFIDDEEEEEDDEDDEDVDKILASGRGRIIIKYAFYKKESRTSGVPKISKFLSPIPKPASPRYTAAKDRMGEEENCPSILSFPFPTIL